MSKPTRGQWKTEHDMVKEWENDRLLSKLRKSIDSSLPARLPYCAGTCPIPPEKSVLSYGNDDSEVSRIDLSSPTPEELDSLSNACQPASFGVNHEQVYDESYRKAGKMTIANFATHFSKDSFFKAHKDTPRHGNMFGTLVVIFPTQHEGGEFVLRQRDLEWSLDFAKTLPDSSHPPCATSGHRVTPTYILHFIPESQASVEIASAPAPYEGSLATPLYVLLTDPTVLPSGGYLAFGLRRHYPIETGTNVTDYKSCLKGTDAAFGRVLTNLGMVWNVMVVVNLSGAPCEIHDFSEAMGETAVHVEFASIDGIPRVRRHPNAETPPRHFAKARKVNNMTCSRSPYVMAGYSRAEVGELTGEVCIVVELQEPVKRVVRKVDSMKIVEVGA
ncbi:hypothetical protein EDD17DRAFT_1506652 [Pisolithus thermaeus]|nr:hypothetical protein EV401DRAFT_1892529 [Pisolithus croceorrhizus]KAI6164151.1 hypothetical protein EDD17DRAFT_1506652 [Pisolithus thermaeus]